MGFFVIVGVFCKWVVWGVCGWFVGIGGSVGRGVCGGGVGCV